MKSEALRATLSRLPVEGVQTVLASGNAVAGSALPPADLKAAAEAVLREDFGYEAWVVVLTLDRLRELTGAVPYPPDDPATHAYVTFGSDAGMLAELFEAAEAAGAEQVRLGADATAWPCPRAGTLDSPLSKISAKPRYKAHTTTRNVRTLHRIIAAGEKLEGKLERPAGR